MLKIDSKKLLMAVSAAALTVKGAAEKAGLSVGLVSKMLNGHSVNVRPSTVGKLAKALECKVEDLLQD